MIKDAVRKGIKHAINFSNYMQLIVTCHLIGVSLWALNKVNLDLDLYLDLSLLLVAAFLIERRMVVKVGQVMSKPREVTGGCPQGSILGVFLFNATIMILKRTVKNSRILAYRSNPSQPRYRPLQEEIRRP